MHLSATAMSHALEELVGHVDRLQRSLIFSYFWLEQGADQQYISPIRVAHVKGQNRGIHAERRDPSIVHLGSAMTRSKGQEYFM
jgi:hypothetical protein